MQKTFIFNKISLFYIDLSLKKIYALTIFSIKNHLRCQAKFLWSLLLRALQVIICFLDIFLLFLKIYLIAFLLLKSLGQATRSSHHNLRHLRLRHRN